MIDITDKNNQPNLTQIIEFADNPLFSELCEFMQREYNAVIKIEYSGDNALPGWNVKFKKTGKTLCTLYPRPRSFSMLLVIGRKEKQQVEEMMPEFSEEFRNMYFSTQEGMGQRWILLFFKARTAVYEDALKIISIRRQSK